MEVLSSMSFFTFYVTDVAKLCPVGSRQFAVISWQLGDCGDKGVMGLSDKVTSGINKRYNNFNIKKIKMEID